MCRLFETIRIADGIPLNLSLHNERMNHSRKILFGLNNNLDLNEYINVPDDARRGITRCRIIYAESVISVEYIPYVPSVTRSLRIVDAGNLDYDHKYLDRSGLNSLIDKKIADDILIIRNGYVTDTSYSNILFTDGKKWVTPDTPLLKGTMRKFLLGNGTVTEEKITVNNLTLYTHFRLINAMLGNDSQILPVSSIV